MAGEVFNVVNDLVEYLLFELKSRNMWIDEFRMQKLIFKKCNCVSSYRICQC